MQGASGSGSIAANSVPSIRTYADGAVAMKTVSAPISAGPRP